MSFLEIIAGERSPRRAPPMRCPETKRAGTVFPHIKAAAASLGVHRVTLYRVLMGQHPDNRGLKAGYKTFAAQQRGARR